MKKLFFTVLCCLPLSALAQIMSCVGSVSEANRAFGAGEKLSYEVVYSASIINASVADIEFHTTKENYASKPCFKISAVGKTRPFFNMFFELEDTYTSWIETESLRPVRAISMLKEGGYRYRSAIDYNWNAMKAYTLGVNIKANHETRRTLSIGNCSYDALALFFNLRCSNLSGIVSGETQRLSLVLEDTVRSIRLRYLGRENRKVVGVGEFKTLKFACQFATSSDESFKDGAEFFIWLTDDKNCIPVYLESPIKVGKVYATLRSWSGLKHPFSSIIIK